MSYTGFLSRRAGLLILCVFIGIASVTVSSAAVTELTVSPAIVAQGGALSISGKALPNEEVWISSSFELSLPVSGDGEYACEFTGIEFPAGEKTFSVTAEGVKNVRASIRPIFWQTVEYPLEGPLDATGGTATLSVSFPAELFGVEMDVYGEKDVKVYGDAADGATSVNLDTTTSIKVTAADSNGDFILVINTTGVPLGEFSITAGSKEKTVEVAAAGVTQTPMPTPSPTPSGSAVPETTPTPTLTPTPTQASTPGFETLCAIAGLLAVAYLLAFVRKKPG